MSWFRDSTFCSSLLMERILGLWAGDGVDSFTAPVGYPLAPEAARKPAVFWGGGALVWHFLSRVLPPP